MKTNLWSANSETDVYVISINYIIPIYNCIYNRLILKPTYSSLKYFMKKGEK